MNNKLPTQDQLALRVLVESLARDEQPLDNKSLMQLQHFVKVVRWEVVETDRIEALCATLPNGQTVELAPHVPGSARRVNYYMLNDRGVALLDKWRRGLLDKHLA